MARINPAFAALLFLVLCLGMKNASAAEATGKVKSVDVDKKQMVIADGNQKSWTFEMAKDGKVFVDDKSAALAELTAGQEVIVTYEKDGDRLLATIVRSKKK